MDPAILAGIIGGLIGGMIAWMVTKATKNKITNGELKYGGFILSLAIASLILTLGAIFLFLNDDNIYADKSELFYALVLIVCFGVLTLSSFAEYFKVKGNFDTEGIEFYTPWTGWKKEAWDNVSSVKHNLLMSWYTISFKSGKKIRLSSYLLGHGQVLDILKARGYKV